MVVTGPVRLREIVNVVFLRHRRRAILGLSLMVAQAFFYNAIFFTYGIILERFHGVKADRVGLYILPFALGNFAGPLLLGPLFDRLGRRIDDPAHVRALRAVAHRNRRALRFGETDRRFPDASVVRGVLLRLGCGELCLLDGQRIVSGARAGDRHCDILRDRDDGGRGRQRSSARSSTRAIRRVCSRDTSSHQG